MDLIANTNQFAILLDKKVHFYNNDLRYSDIYIGIDTIAKRI